MKAKIHVYLLLILIFLIIPSLSYSQEATVNIAVLEFYNESGLSEYDYLSTAIQNSIYTTLEKSISEKNQTDIKLIPLLTVSEEASNFGLDYTTMNNTVNILKFSLETGANIIIFGKYNTDSEAEFLSVEIPIYSIAKRDFLTRSNYEVETGADLFNFINTLSLSTTKIIQDNKEDILVSIEELYEEANPPYQTEELHFTMLREEFIQVEWVTNKETISELYMTTEPDYVEEAILHTYPDETEDALNHTAKIPFNHLPESEFNYYLISSDTDILGQTTLSEAQDFSQSRLEDVADTLFEEEKTTLISEALSFAEQNQFEDALGLLLFIKDNVVPVYDNYTTISDESMADVYDAIRQVFEMELNQTYDTINSLANQNRFEAAEDYINTIYDEIIPKYEPYIDIDMNKIEQEVEKLKKQIKREEIASVNEEGVEYFPYYARLSALHFGFSSAPLNSTSETPIIATSGIEAGISILGSGFYPFLKLSLPYYIFIENSSYFIFQSIIPAIGMRFFTKPTRITYNFGLYMEAPFGMSNDNTDYHIALTLDGGVIMNMPLGFYFNGFVNIILTDFGIEAGIEGGFNWFLGEEVPPPDVEFDTSLYNLMRGLYMGAKFIHILPVSVYNSDYNITFGAVPVMFEFGFVVKRDLLLYGVVGVSLTGGDMGIQENPTYKLEQSFPQMLIIAPGIEWLINPSNQMLSLYVETNLDLLYLSKEDSPGTYSYSFHPYISIIPGVGIQFLFPAGAYFKIGLPILLIPDLSLGVQFSFGIRWYD